MKQQQDRWENDGWGAPRIDPARICLFFPYMTSI